MEDQLKKTLADYLKTDASAIGNDTVIDRSALGNSILLHRLYAAFSQQGYNVSNYNTVRTFGELKLRLSLGESSAKGAEETIASGSLNTPEKKIVDKESIGVDIEAIERFEVAQDYREHSFYKGNFTSREISYCLLQHNARISFAGLFAAKEAIVKADNSLIGTPFNAIEIQHDKNGKPGFKNFLLSISHTDTVAFAMAFQPQPERGNAIYQPTEVSHIAVSSPSKNPSFVVFFALILSIIALILALLSLLKH